MLLVDAALHSLALCAAAWIGMKALRADNPHVEMMVWKLVLAGSLAMPLVLPWMTVRLPDWPLPAAMDHGVGRTPIRPAAPWLTATPDLTEAGAAPSERSTLSPDPVAAPAENNPAATPRPFLATPDWITLVTGLYVLISGALLLR
jgi:hypothetical protein